MKSESMTTENAAAQSSNQRLWHWPLRHRKALGALYHVLTFDAPEALAARPGQFAMLRSQRWSYAPLLSRPMSLMAGGTSPSMLIKVVGEGTAKMAMAEPGEIFSLLAPLGRAFSPCPEDCTPILVAGGVGAAPLLFFAQALAAQGRVARMLYGGRSQHDLPLLDALSEITELHIATEDGSLGEHGRVTLLLSRCLSERKNPQKPKIYTCGPEAMMRAVHSLCSQAGVDCEVSLETPMACGYGVCLGCAVPKAGGGFLYACTEGPCIDANALAWSGR